MDATLEYIKLPASLKFKQQPITSQNLSKNLILGQVCFNFSQNEASVVNR